MIMSNKLHLSLVLFLSFFSAIAQVTTSNMSGSVVDDQNLPLLGANVVVVHTPTGTKSGAITNEDGLFKILNLRLGGPYSVTVSYIGFKEKTLDDIYLSLGKTFTLDVVLATESQALDEVVVISDRGGTYQTTYNF